MVLPGRYNRKYRFRNIGLDSTGQNFEKITFQNFVERDTQISVSFFTGLTHAAPTKDILWIALAMQMISVQ